MVKIFEAQASETILIGVLDEDGRKSWELNKNPIQVTLKSEITGIKVEKVLIFYGTVEEELTDRMARSIGTV